MTRKGCNIIFMGTPAFALPSLQALHVAGYNISAVYTQPPRPAGRGQKESPSPVHQFALEHGLSVYTPTSLRTEEAVKEFRSHGAMLAVVVAYGLLLPKPILEATPHGCINVHPSRLPRWRGAAPIQRTIMAGDSDTEIAIMRMDEGLDTGPTLLRKHYAIPLGTNSGMLHDMLAEQAAPLLIEAIELILSGNAQCTAQGDHGVTYAPKIRKDECHIDWQQSAESIYHRILGLAPSPGAHFVLNGEAIKIFDARFTLESLPVPPGQTINDALTISCNPGTITPLELQRPGKKRMPVTEALRGMHIPAGTKLE